MFWPAGSFLCTYCSVAAVAAPPLARTSAPVVVHSLLHHVTADSAMPATGVPSAAMKFGAAVKTSISKRAASGAQQARAPRRFSTQHRLSCGSSAVYSDSMWRRFRSIHCVRRVSTGLRGRNARQREAALWPPALASSCSTIAAEVPASIHTRLLRNTASETRREGVPAVATVSPMAKWWQARAPQARITSQYSGNSSQQHAGPTAARRSETQPLASAGHSAGPPGSEACRSTIARVLEAARSNAATPRGSNGRVPTILADVTEKFPLAWAGVSGVIRAAAGRRRHCVEREAPMDTNGSPLPLSPAVNECESRPAAEATPQILMRGQRYSDRLCSMVVSARNSASRIWATSSCPPRPAVGLAGSRVSLLEPDSFNAGEKTVVVHGVSSIVRKQCSTWNYRNCAFISSRAASPTYMVLDGSSAKATSKFAADDATSWLIAPDYFPAAATGAVARAREGSTSEFLADACTGPRGKTAAGNTTANVTKAAMAAWVKTWSTVPLTVLLQQRRPASYFPLPPCRTVLRKYTHLCNTQPQSRMRLLDGRLRRSLSAWLFSARHDRRHTEVTVTYERQRSDSANKVFSYVRISSISSSAKLPVSKTKTRHALPLVKPFFSPLRKSGSGSGTKCAAGAAAAIQGGPRPSGGAGAPGSAAASIVTVSAATDVLSPASATSGGMWYFGDLASLYTGVTHLPHAFIPARTTWLELNSPLRRRHYGAASRGLELCGNVSSGASVDTSISARSASSSDAVAAAAASGQQQLPTQKRLLSFDACTIRIPHPNKRAKGGEDASACSPRLLVVADGVGGWGMSGVDAGLYSRELVQRLRDEFEECCDEKHVQQQEQQQSGGRDSAVEGGEKSVGGNTRRSVVFERTPDPVQLLKAAYLTTRAIGSSTCCLVVLDRLQQRVRCANIGDSGFILYRPSKDTIVARSNFQSHDFNFPLQLGTGSSDMPEHAHVLELPVQEGDVFLLATDGLWDNLYDEQVLAVFRRDLDVQEAAEELSQLAFKCSQDPTWNSPFATKEKEVLGLPGRHAGGKPDDITVVVAVLKGDVNERTEAGS